MRLETVFRQASSSSIVLNADRVNRGEVPQKGPEGEASDFYLIERDDPADCLRIIKEMVTKRVPERFHFDPVQDVQVLSPMHKGTIGTENLNRELRDAWIPWPGTQRRAFPGRRQGHADEKQLRKGRVQRRCGTYQLL